MFKLEIPIVWQIAPKLRSQVLARVRQLAHQKAIVMRLTGIWLETVLFCQTTWLKAKRQKGKETGVI